MVRSKSHVSDAVVSEAATATFALGLPDEECDRWFNLQMANVRQENHLFPNESSDAETQDRARFITTFMPFNDASEVVLAVHAGISRGSSLKVKMLGQGAFSTGYEFIQDGHTYAMRIIDSISPVRRVEAYRKGLTAGAGKPRLEQVVGGSYSKGAVVSRRMPGKHLDCLTRDELSSITPGDLFETLSVIKHSGSFGVKLDMQAGNVLYAPPVGFGFIDYDAASDSSREYMPQVYSFIEIIRGARTGRNNNKIVRNILESLLEVSSSALGHEDAAILKQDVKFPRRWF